MIELDNISVTFQSKNNRIEAVREVSLSIRKGEVYGIVGTSGAGKSTLLRTINLLERPSSGRVLINGVEITAYRGEELRRTRLGIGMIFQQFNLLQSQSVFANIAFALKVAGKSPAEIARRVPELLALVELTGKEDAYPGQLSGGQKQRVGIARALANDPDILLCDEPTSALDLETTAAILALLRSINRRLGITMVLISHEMTVIKEVCDRVAVMQDGRVVEAGDAYTIFAAPQHPFTRQLVARALDLTLPERVFDSVSGQLVKLVFRGARAEEPILSELLRSHQVTVNVLHGRIEYIGEQPLGILIVDVSGLPAAQEQAVGWLRANVADLEVLHVR